MKKQINCKEVVWELFTLTAAVAIIAAAVYFFLVPSHASVSSISGLGIVLSNFIPLPLSVITMILNVVLLLIGSALQIGTYAAPMLAAFLIIPVLEEYGPRYALTLYATVSILAVLFVPETELAFFYVLVMGYYPVLRVKLNTLKNTVLRWVIKFAVFNAATVLEGGFFQRRKLDRWLKDGLVDAISSDAHNCTTRATRMQAAYERLCGILGQPDADALTGRNNALLLTP